MMGKKALITGGAGFIGTHLADRLVQENYAVILYDNFRRDALQYAPQLKDHSRIDVHRGDVLDANELSHAMKGCDVVLHLAAIAGVSSYYRESFKTLRVNLMGTLNVLETMDKTDVQKVIDFSTSEVYGPEAEFVNEESPHRIGPVSEKRWVYAVSKLASEHLTIRFGEEKHLKAACVRPFNIYGPRQVGEGAIRNFSFNLLQGKPIQIYGDGTEIRTWCYVSDIIDAVLLLLDNDHAFGHSYNIGNSRPAISTNELARLVIDTFGGGAVEHIDSPHAPVKYRRPDVSKAETRLGFHPKVGIEDGLKQTIQWYRENIQ